MKTKLTLFLILLSGLSCNKTPVSNVKGIPTLEEDPVTLSYREKFKSAHPIVKEQMPLLRLENEWFCNSRMAERGNSGEIPYTMKFVREHEFIKLETDGEVNVKLYTFAKQGLVGVVPKNGPDGKIFPRMAAWRINSENEIVAEGYGIPMDKSGNVVPAVTDPKSGALTYTVCNIGQTSRPDVESVSGACAVDDSEFNTEEGGCLDLTTGLVWSMSEESTTDQFTAEEECSKLVDSGKDDWRLPLEPELLKLASDPARVSAHFYFDANRSFWTRDLGNAPFSWAVDLASATPVYIPRTKELAKTNSATGIDYRSAAVVCIRQPIDGDGDHIPDSSDRCAKTPAKEVVMTEGARKGCAATDNNTLGL